MNNGYSETKLNVNQMSFIEKMHLTLEKLPRQWQKRRLKFFLRALESGNRQTGGGNQLDSGVFSIGGEHISWGGKLILDSPKYISEEFFAKLNSGKIKKDDVLLVKDGATIGKAAIVNQLPFDHCAVNEHVFILRANKKVAPGFLYFLIISSLGQSQILSLISGAAQPGLNSLFVNKTRFPFPPLPEQRAIADFLDHQTAKIDALIEKQERLLKLLEEKRNALISQAVTKGLNPDVPMKDSGVEWLGEIPEHWSIRRLKFLSKINPSISERNNINEKIDVTFLPMENLGEGNLELNLIKKLSEVRTGFTYFAENDVLIAKITPSFENNKGAIAKNLTNKIGFGTTELHVIRANKKIIPEFLFLVTSSYHFRSVGTHYMKGVAGQQRVDKVFLTNFPFAYPHIEEQHKIVAFINKFDGDHKKLKNKIISLIKNLNKFREIIITSTVTGKIDVRNWREEKTTNLE